MYDIIEGLNFSFDFDQYMTPIWSGDTVYNETVNFLTLEDKAPLLYPISEIISVKSFDLKTTYKQGVDYDIDDGKIVLLEGTSIPYMTREYYYFSDTSNTVLTMDGDVERSTAFGATATYQVVVTYKHTKEWNGHKVECKKEQFESFIGKLERGEDVTVLFFGDSITFGAAASVISFGEPKMPPWNELIVLYLAQKYEYTVHYHPLSVTGARQIVEKNIVLGDKGTIHVLNSGVPGWTGEGAVSAFNTHVKELRDQYGCDLLVLGFGMNDGGYTVEKERNVFTQLLDKVFEMDPELPVLQVATMVPNIDSTNWYKNQHLFEDVYIDVCEDFAEQGKSCAVATMTSLSLSICDSKRFRDFSDNICHPTDFVMRAYAQSAIQTLIGYDE